MTPKYDVQSYDESLRNAGYKDTDDLLTQNPRCGYDEIANQLDEIPPIVVIREHLAHRMRQNRVLDGLKESLYRTIIEKFNDGWPVEGRDWSVVRPISGWSAEMISTCGLIDRRTQIEKASEYILDNARKGWVPGSTDDPIIEGAFQDD